jgi:hypothetical protein
MDKDWIGEQMLKLMIISIALVVLFLSGDTTFFTGLILLALLVMIPHIPRRSGLEELLKKYDMMKAMGMADQINWKNR